MKGMITGLTLDDSVNDLARKFNIALEVCSLETTTELEMACVLMTGNRITDSTYC